MEKWLFIVKYFLNVGLCRIVCYYEKNPVTFVISFCVLVKLVLVVFVVLYQFVVLRNVLCNLSSLDSVGVP